MLSEEDRKWFMEAMQAQTIDLVKRMKEITLVMQTPDNLLEEDVGRTLSANGSMFADGTLTGTLYRLRKYMLEKLKPPCWFSTHLHCKFAALVQHGDGGQVTKFLALDKWPRPYEIQYDEEC
nr:lariat debranching enzyme isoform X1 [Tanacetum cinerariifolium]